MTEDRVEFNVTAHDWQRRFIIRTDTVVQSLYTNIRERLGEV
jgi:hypothetical protein